RDVIAGADCAFTCASKPTRHRANSAIAMLKREGLVVMGFLTAGAGTKSPLRVALPRAICLSGVLGLIPHWELAKSLASRRVDRIGHCWRDRGGPCFAHPARRLAAVDDVNLDCGRLVHPQHHIIVEIVLLDATALERDLSTERRRDSEDDRALDLRPHGIGIDDSAAVDRADNTPDTNR